eukprot:5332791-Amphidinium_carterae.1
MRRPVSAMSNGTSGAWIAIRIRLQRVDPRAPTTLSLKPGPEDPSNWELSVTWHVGLPVQLRLYTFLGPRNPLNGKPLNFEKWSNSVQK